MHWIGPVRWLIDSIAKPLGADMAVGLHVRHVDIDRDGDAVSGCVTFTYAFDCAAPMKGNVAALDLSTCPLSLRGLKGNGCHLRGPMRFGDKQVVFCELLPGEDWRNVSAQIRVAWPDGSRRGSSLSLAILPDMLPALLNESFQVRRWPQPTLHCSDNVKPAAFVATSVEKSSDLWQLALFGDELSGAVQARPHVEIDLGTGLSHLGEAERTRIASLLAEITAFVATDLRYDLSARILALAVDRRRVHPRVWGPCLAEEPSTYGESDGRVGHLLLGQDVAGLWWGAGVRLVGSSATNLSMAICAALGIRWTEHVDPARAARCFDGYVTLSQDARRPDSERVWWRWVVSLYAGFGRSEGVMDALRQLTAEHYGYYVPAESIVARLTDVGVALD
jgi:hypothetical protein